METIEVAILGLIQTYCKCPVDNAKFHNSTSSCSNGVVTFSSTLAHVSDDGTVTATVLIEAFKAELSKEDHPTITAYGQELAVYLPVEDDSDSSNNAMALFLTGIASIALLVVVMCIIIFSW